MIFFKKLPKRYYIVMASIALATSLFCFSAFALNIVRSKLSLHEKSNTVVVHNPDLLDDGNTITPDIEFSEVGGFITYKLTLSDNDSSSYRIANISDTNLNDAISVSYSYDDSTDASDKDVFITLTYDHIPEQSSTLTNFDATIGYEATATDNNEENDEDLPVPNTSDQTDNTNAPNTGNYTPPEISSPNIFSHTTVFIIFSIGICASVISLYFLFRRSRQNVNFNLTKSSHRRQSIHTIIGLAIAGVIITGGAISITHATNNSSINLSFDLSKVVINTTPTSYTATFINNAPNIVTAIQDESKSCNLLPDETSCEITLPTFATISGHEVIGWNTDPSAKSALYQPSETIVLSANTTFYTITRGQLSASFINQHDAYFDISAQSDSCYIYNSTLSCQVTTPTANKKTTDSSTFLGWSTDANATTPEITAGNSVSISETTAFYSVASLPPTTVSVLFVNQDTTGLSISETSATCDIQTGSTNCSIALPTITADTGYEALGWSKSANSTSAPYTAGQTVTVTQSTTFYTVSRKNITATFTNLHNDYFNISSSAETCYLYNGATDSCSISAPTITKLSSDEKTTFLGWNTNPNTQAGMETSNTIIIQESTTYYSIAKVPTDTTYSLKFAGGLYGGSIGILTYFNPATDCTSEEESSTGDMLCVEVTKTCTIYTWESSCSITAPNFNTTSEWDTYGYDTILSSSFYGPSQKTENFAEIGDDIAVTASTNNSTLYALIKSHDPVVVTFVNQHASYLTASSSSESCYIFNNNVTCNVTTPSLTPIDPNSSITNLAWSMDPDKYQYQETPGDSTIIAENTTYYSVATGVPYTITFDKNVDFPGSGSNDEWGKQDNIAADSLSFYSTKCNVTENGCYITNPPRIYSTGNTPLGFSLRQYGDLNLVNLTTHSFVKDTTVYARNFNWDNVQASYTTSKIYQPNSNTEYYQIDFETSLSEEFINAYRTYLEQLFENVPQLFALRGKMRFLNGQTFRKYHGPNGIMFTYMYGLYAPIDASPNINGTTIDSYTYSALVHEMGHALDSAWQELYGSSLTSQADFQQLYATYKAEYDAYLEAHDGQFHTFDGVPLRTYAYSDILEFLADSFSVWYTNKSGTTGSRTLGFISDDISNTIDSYVCNPNNTKLPFVTSSPICSNPSSTTE